ncbi:hypothetical protein RHGRI_013001 [Rhododendron griersonianum]|uniref:Calmodulin-binding family protein n=1 Tax=Rhododendron griersonianum TaxID=479676 RepID=A0AAV6K472_9ERIC|nr:hypothetical protein RHGRI_013001 [Rhododendron griersonianum]KAG5547176.1 hypothetical protein RHGRI_013001 [Rhododendron griersonianum]
MTLRTNSFKQTDSETGFDLKSSKNSINLKNCEPMKVMLETTLSFKNRVQGIINSGLNKEVDGSIDKSVPSILLPEPAIVFSPRPVSELDAAVVTLQKVYKGYRTRRNLADCAVVVEELWWKALDFAALRQSSVSFFSVEKHETAGSRWARARTRAAKVGKGLSKDEKAKKLARQHWLEAIDPRHRHGNNLDLYFDIWFDSESTQPFFYWLDVGDGKEVNLESCPRVDLQRQCIKYLGPKEREAYEVIVENGKLVSKQTGLFIETTEGSNWVFVLSTSRTLYVGQKKKGVFQHSSFLSGGATTAAGRLVAHAGILEAIWPYSGHYQPTEENFQEFISFLQEHNVDLTNVLIGVCKKSADPERCAIDDHYLTFSDSSEEPKPDPVTSLALNTQSEEDTTNTSYVDVAVEEASITTDHQEQEDMEPVDANVQAPFDFAKRLSCKWSTGTGPRIGCVRDYPTELQFQALEQVNLLPRIASPGFGYYGPIPSPRPSPKVPRLAYVGVPSPRTPVPTASQGSWPNGNRK